MFCNKCGKQTKNEEQFCEDCKKGNERNNNNKNTEKKVSFNKNFLVIILIVCVVIVGIMYFSKNNQDGGTGTSKNSKLVEQTGANGQIRSFANMKLDNEELNLDDTQKEILKYFDNDYFLIHYYNYVDIERYPKVYKGAQLTVDCSIQKIIKSTDEEFEALVCYAVRGYGDIDESKLFILKSKQLDERMIVGDIITLYGRYTDIATQEIDGTSYTVPVINAFNIIKNTEQWECRFNLNTITTVAKHIFGNDIKIREPVDGYVDEDTNFDFELGPYYSPQDPFYLVTLDNQSNSNFKVFDIFRERGYIGYNRIHNTLPDTITKKLFISVDFQHFIVTTYDYGTRHVYIDYFDRDYKKIWSREFDYESNADIDLSPMDYTEKQMAVVIDNDLYLIDMQTGENIIEPVIVGERLKIIMVADGIFLIGNNNKDFIMKVDYTGKIVAKINADTEMQEIEDVNLQIVNGKVVVYLESVLYEDTVGYNGQIYNRNIGTISKYIVLNNDGTIDMKTNDIIEDYR